MTDKKTNATKRQAAQQRAAQRVHRLVQQIDAQPDDDQAYYALATELVDLGSYDQAEELLVKAIQRFQTATTVVKDRLVYGLGNVYYAAGEYDQAVGQFQQLTTSNLKVEAYLMLAQSAMGQGNHQKGLVFALTAQGFRPQDPEINQLVADNLLALGSMAEAYEFYSRALAVDSKNGKSYFNRGLAAMALGKPFAVDFDRAQALDPAFVKHSQSRIADIERAIQFRRHQATD